MKRREKIMLISTAVIVALGVGMTFMPEDWSVMSAVGAGDQAPAGDLQAEIAKFNDNFGDLKNANEINEGFAAIDDRMHDKIGRLDHEKTFQNELEAMLKNQLNVPTPKISKTSSVYIPNVDDYYFVELDFSADGTREAMAQLLIDLETRGLLIMKCRMARDRERCTLNVTIARLFKHDADSLRKRDRSAHKNS